MSLLLGVIIIILLPSWALYDALFGKKIEEKEVKKVSKISDQDLSLMPSTFFGKVLLILFVFLLIGAGYCMYLFEQGV